MHERDRSLHKNDWDSRLLVKRFWSLKVIKEAQSTSKFSLIKINSKSKIVSYNGEQSIKNFYFQFHIAFAHINQITLVYVIYKLSIQQHIYNSSFHIADYNFVKSTIALLTSNRKLVSEILVWPLLCICQLQS